MLLDHGVTDDILEKLVQAGIPTVERLGGMTPEELEAIPGIDPAMVERIQAAVNGYYGQFEASVEGVAAAAPEAPEAPETPEIQPEPAAVATGPENESVRIENADARE